MIQIARCEGAMTDFENNGKKRQIKAEKNLPSATLKLP